MSTFLFNSAAIAPTSPFLQRTWSIESPYITHITINSFCHATNTVEAIIGHIRPIGGVGNQAAPGMPQIVRSGQHRTQAGRRQLPVHATTMS